MKIDRVAITQGILRKLDPCEIGAMDEGIGAVVAQPQPGIAQIVLGEGTEQALLFLNRRGFAPLTLCRACGHRFQCGNCTAWLVEHRYTRTLQCHHCGHSEPAPETCPDCGAEGSLTAIGPGVERVAEEVRTLFPAARVLEMSSDTVHGAHSAAAMAAMIENREIDLIVGTQLVAKGWHFPHLTLVGVVDADLGLAGGDLRAAERTFQVLHQVGGRAGRAAQAGRVLLQTWQPAHPVMQALVSGEVERFVARARPQVVVLAAARVGGILSAGVRGSRSAGRLLSNRIGWLVSVTVVVILAASQLLYVMESELDYSTALYEAALATITGTGFTADDSFARLLQLVLAVYSVAVFATLAGSLGAFFLQNEEESAGQQR